MPPRRDLLVLLAILIVVGGGGAIFIAITVLGFPQALQDIAEGERVVGMPVPWQFNFSLPFSPVQEQLYDFHNYLFIISVGITGFVTALLLYAAWRFHESRNPTPSRVTHNTLLEVVWTTVPVLILVTIAIPSFRILYYTHTVADAEMTIKATGRQWYWDYEYQDHGDFTFSSVILPEEELPPDQKDRWLFAVDQPVVLPVDTTVRVLITAGDVNHAWAVPSLGVKRDAIPGQINETWLRIDREGVYYGQCSELCGINHAYMPIEIHGVPREEFDAWVAEMQEEFAREAPSPSAAELAASKTQ